MTDEQVSVRIVAESNALREFEEDAAVTVQGAEPVRPEEPLADARFVEWIAIAVAGSVAALVNHLLRLWAQQTERGVVLDMSTSPPTVSYVANIPYGTLVLRQEDGRSVVHHLKGTKSGTLEALFMEIAKAKAKNG